MKKLTTIAAMLGAVSLSFGQGYVAFFNTPRSKFSTNGVVAGGPAGSYYFALLAAPTTQTTITTVADPTLNGWSFTGVGGTNTGSPGRLLGSTAPDGLGAYVPGHAANTEANFAVVGWSSNIGTGWTQAQAWWHNGQANGTVLRGTAAYFGISSVATNIPLLPANGFAGYYNPALGYLTGMNLTGYSIPALDITSLALRETNLVINAANGVAGGTYEVLMSTDVRLPLNQWTPVATNVLTGSGDFTITATNAVSPGAPQRFFVLQAH